MGSLKDPAETQELVDDMQGLTLDSIISKLGPEAGSLNQLNRQQRIACLAMVKQLDAQPRPRVVQGPPGTGKSTLLANAVQQLVIQALEPQPLLIQSTQLLMLMLIRIGGP